MIPEQVDALKPGDLVFKWWDTGALGVSPINLVVVRVNRLTLTCDTRHHGRGRVHKGEIVDFWKEEDAGDADRAWLKQLRGEP